MALLQISEPGQAPDPHQRRIAVGIDLGTTHSLVAAVRNGVAECLPDEGGHVILPSAVRYLADGRRVIGARALEGQGEDPLNTVVSVKRLMGRRLGEVPRHESLPYRFVDEPQMVRIETDHGVKSPVEVSAEILATLRQRAEDTFDSDLFGAVITVPAYFDDAQRQATKDAARLAGLDVLRLINEPTAAAIAYGLENDSEGLYAVYDLGGGTFDVSLLRLQRGVFEVAATGGDSSLGGDDIDRLLADHVLEQSAVSVNSPHDKRRILQAARAAKEDLSSRAETIFEARLGTSDLRVTIRRDEFERLVQPVVDRTMAAVRKVLRDAKVSADEVQGVVMVGGSTRIPIIREVVGRAFGKPPLIDLDPDQVVALGAAIQANSLAGNAEHGELLLLDVIPLSLGIETMGGLVERIIPRNSTIPTARAQDFTTYQDGQTAMALHVVQGERELVADCRSLGRFELRDIPAMTAGAARIRVTFEVDADGLLNVQASEETSGVQASISVKPSYGLADDEIARMLQESFTTADTDMESRLLREAVVEADRLVLAIRSALSVDADLLSEAERDDIWRRIDELVQASGGMDRMLIEQRVKDLADATENFAAERMNRGIRNALSGRRIDEL